MIILKNGKENIKEKYEELNQKLFQMQHTV